MKLQRLKELALGATKEKWQHIFDDEDCEYNIRTEFTNGAAWQVGIADNEDDAAYIAAACPANILPFLESYEELLALLKVSACPICDGQGAFYDGHGDVCQCQFCDERAKAITNAEKLNHE